MYCSVLLCEMQCEVRNEYLELGKTMPDISGMLALKVYRP